MYYTLYKMSSFQNNNEWKYGTFYSVQTFLISETNNLTLQKQMVFFRITEYN